MKPVRFGKDQGLEGRVYRRREPLRIEPERVIIVTHPHPKLGGDFENHVVVTLATHFSNHASIETACLTFNTRGVGGSRGSSTWRGTAEIEDIRESFLFALNEFPGATIHLVAYSFGAAVGLSALRALAPEQLGRFGSVVTIGYPKGFQAMFLFSSHYPNVSAPSSVRAQLFVCGDSDQFSSVDTMRTLTERARVGQDGAPRERAELVVLEGCDHFFATRRELAQLTQALDTWLASLG